MKNFIDFQSLLKRHGSLSLHIMHSCFRGTLCRSRCAAKCRLTAAFSSVVHGCLLTAAFFLAGAVQWQSQPSKIAHCLTTFTYASIQYLLSDGPLFKAVQIRQWCQHLAAQQMCCFSLHTADTLLVIAAYEWWWCTVAKLLGTAASQPQLQCIRSGGGSLLGCSLWKLCPQATCWRGVEYMLCIIWLTALLLRMTAEWHCGNLKWEIQLAADSKIFSWCITFSVSQTTQKSAYCWLSDYLTPHFQWYVKV